MARTTENVCLTLRPEIVKAVDAARGKGRDAQSRSQFVDLILERALTGQGRLEALQAIADAGLEEYAANHAPVRGPNPAEAISESSHDGHRRLAALEIIAKGRAP